MEAVYQHLLAVQGGRAWQRRLREWQGLTVSLAKQQVPAVYTWLGAQTDSFVERQNLTEVRDIAILPSSLALPTYHAHRTLLPRPPW